MSTPITAIRFPFAINDRLGRLAQENDYEQYIKRLVFAPNSPATASLAQTLIFQGLTTWLGTLIRTDDVKAEADNERLNITIVYTILAKQERRFLNVEVTL